MIKECNFTYETDFKSGLNSDCKKSLSTLFHSIIREIIKNDGGNLEGGNWIESSDFQGKGETKNVLLFMVKKWLGQILSDVEGEIGCYYSDDQQNIGDHTSEYDSGKWIPVGYFWARTIPCQNPKCTKDIPLLQQFWLCRNKKKNRRVALYPRYDETDQFEFSVIENKELDRKIDEGFDPSGGTIDQANASCLKCGQVTKSNEIQALAKKGKMGQRLMAVVYHHPNQRGKRYKTANQEQKETYQSASEELEKKLNAWTGLEEPLPTNPVPEGGGPGAERAFTLRAYGIKKWEDLFNKRQKLFFVTIASKIRDSYSDIKDDCQIICDVNGFEFTPEEFSSAIIGYISLLMSRNLSFNTNLTRWKPSTEQNIPILSARPGLTMKWDYFETNPLSGSCGTLNSIIPHFETMLERLSRIKNTAEVRQENCLDLKFSDNSFDAVFTDPPYYDNVAYAPLSDFFYEWLKKSVGKFFPDLFSTPSTPKSDEIVTYTYDRNFEEAKEEFEEKMRKSFEEFHRILKPGGIAVIVYAHKTTEGWESMLNGLIESGFSVTGSWPIHTEMSSRLRAAQSATLASSIYMVCRKNKREKVGYFNELKPEIKEKVKSKLNQFWREGIRGGDFFISAIGPAMEVFSNFERVERFSGEKVSTNDLLDYIRGITSDYLTDRLLDRASGEDLDDAARFYLTYRWTFLDDESRKSKDNIEFNDARRIAAAEGIDMENFYDSFIKKGRKYITVLGPQDREDPENLTGDNHMVDTLHRACILWSEDNRDELDKFLKVSEHTSKEGFWQFAQAISETLLDKSTEKSWLEGLLLKKDNIDEFRANLEQKTIFDEEEIE